MSCAYVNVYDGELKKRSGNDIVKSAVNSYLRRRQFMNAEHLRKSEMVLNQSKIQMTIAATVVKDTSTGNSFSYKTINNDVTLAEQQFTKLKTWVTNLSEGKCQQELYPILFPLLCHLYLEILRGGLDRQASSKFLKRHQELAVGQEFNRDIIEDISQVHAIQDIDSKPLIKAFRSSKYEIKLSSVAHAALQKHLTTQSNGILMQILKTWFDIEVVTCSNAMEMEEHSGDDILEEATDYLERIYQQPLGDKDVRNLQESFKSIRASPTPPPSLLLYSLNNTERVHCAKVSRSGKLLATGYSSSHLKLWSVSESKINPSSTCNTSVSLATYTPTQVQTIQEQRHTCLRGHTGSVTGVEFLHEADVLLSVSHDSTMRSWRLTDYSPAAIYRGHNYPVWCVAASSLGLYIATGSHDRTARLWSLDRIYPTRIFAGHSDDVNCVQFHPNGNYLATGSADRTIRLWSVTDCEVVRVYSVNTGSILALAFSPNGQYLASGDDRKVRVWDLTSGGMLAELKGHSMAVTALDWSMDSNILASASSDGTVLVWNSSLHFKPPISENAVNPAKYTTTCTSILSLQSVMRGNLVAVGYQSGVLSSSDDKN